MAKGGGTAGGGEHRVRMPEKGCAGQAGEGAKPEKQLNGFVRAVALIERLGNALGTLAFTWATVVLLGGYPTVLREDSDFWLATAIVFLEAARMFSRNNRLDYQLFFHTKGAVRPLGWNGLVVVVYLSNVYNYMLIPAAVARIVLSLLRIVSHDYYGDKPDDPAKTNLAPSLSIFYWMVFLQGMLYSVACLLEIFSFIPRRALARHGGFRGRCGAECISLYYAYALEKCMEKDVLAPKKISLTSFAMDSIDSDSPKRQLHGIRVMQNLLRMEPTRTLLVLKLKASMNTVARLIEMLDWTSPADRAVRLSAARVVAELAKSLRIISVPGTIKFVSSLLDVDGESERENTLLDTDDEQDKEQGIATDLMYIQEQNHGLAMEDGSLGQRQNPLWDTSSLMETEACSTQQVGMKEQNYCFLRCWKRITRLWSTPQEEPDVDHDHLPALGMSILDSLCCDQDNCVEMSRVAGLIPEIIGFTSYKRYTKNANEVQQKILMRSSLKLLKRLSKTGGEIGITLRHKISEHPLLLTNLSDILDDRFSSQGVRKLVIGILRNLALDANTSKEIGRIQAIIGRLMDAFLKPSATSCKNPNRFLQKVAGQALAMLAMESADNCAAMLMEAGNAIGELASMICENNNRYVAARLLHNVFQNMQPELSSSDMRKLCETLRKVLDAILDAETEGAELEVLIRLSAHICKVIPEYFARELENDHRKEIFVKRLVDALRANMNPAVHCPGIRRVVIEQAIQLMTCNSRYADVFNQYCMVELLLMVERTPSRVERYRIFLGNTGFMEHKEPLADLVAAAKELLCRQWVRGMTCNN
ncbi:uncharacterized protein LOC112881343 [Panicum hallii]|uniref:uncharacterized protein LOC112881343 n=1 Tax=Panicum hallii TaxID=206008 RepID=UPI000DF4E846|nr:uncharacterized protein LOC112881343 [Panicum hallii]